MITSLLPARERVELARTRRMIEDTALAAVPGATLEHLAATDAARAWVAAVRTADGRRLTLRLHPGLATVEVLPAPAMARAA